MTVRPNLAFNKIHAKQKTLVNPAICKGIGVHTGDHVKLEIMPAPENYGIWLERSDLPGENAQIPALWSAVAATDLCTQISNDNGATVATIEHLMAALACLEIDNVHIVVDGPEIPVMDGSSEPFISLLTKAGIQEQSKARRTLRILKEIKVEGSPGRYACLKPSDKFSIQFHMDFSGRQGVQPQSLFFSGAMTRAREEILKARTFGFLEDVQKMQQAGFAKGGSLENAVVVDQGKVMNREGLRYPDEFIRHKILDAIGDLYLVGGPIKGAYSAHNGGHTLNNTLLRALMADPMAWTWEESEEKTAAFWQPLAHNLFEPLRSFG